MLNPTRSNTIIDLEGYLVFFLNYFFKMTKRLLTKHNAFYGLKVHWCFARLSMSALVQLSLWY